MARYKKVVDINGDPCGVLDTTTSTFIPKDNSGYQQDAYIKWLAEGNVPDEAFTEEEVAEHEREERQNIRLRKLKEAIIDQFEMILALFQVGRDKGVWVNTDFDEDLRTKAVEWLAIIAEYKADSV